MDLSPSSVRSSFPWHFETSFEDAGEGWANLKCMFVLFTGLDTSIIFVQGLVYRYDVSKSSDGVAGEEGTFCMCTLWYVFFCLLSSRNTLHQPPFVRCIEALTRAGQTDRQLLPKAVSMFEVCTWG